MADPQHPKKTPTPPPLPLPPPGWSPAPPEVPFWRRILELGGDLVGVPQPRVDAAAHWLEDKLTPTPEFVEEVSRQKDVDLARLAAEARQREAEWAATTAPTRQFLRVPLVQEIGHQIHEDYKPLFEKPPGTTEAFAVLRQDLQEKNDALQAAIAGLGGPVTVDLGRVHPALRGLHPTVDPVKPLQWAAAAEHDWIPNTILDTVESSVTPEGMAVNLAGEAAPLLHAAGPLVAGAEFGLAKLGGLKAAAGLLPPSLIERLFPVLDKFGKPAGRLTAETILKRAETVAADLSPKARKGIQALVKQVGERRVAPAEVQALAKGEPYIPSRVVRKAKVSAEGAKRIPGAPYDVTTARQARDLRESYLRTMGRGAEGRDWYEEAGDAILRYANDDPARARLLAEDLAITSPATAVSGNTGFGVKGYNQATAGVPVVAGRFPTDMGAAIEAAHAEGAGAPGLKRTPFAENLARGGGFLEGDRPARAVHDIWDAEAHGFVNADGSPIRTGFKPAQHRWMDAQQDKILATANAREVGGFTDWDELKSQAATWTGQQIEAGRLAPENAAKSYADYLEGLAAQGSREVTPGPKTGHMPELLEPDMEEFRQRLHERMMGQSGIYDAEGRDQIAAGYGGLVGESFEGPGVYQGQVTPGRQTQVLTGSLASPEGPAGARVLDEGSRRILDASEATHGLLLGQDASAYSRILAAGSHAPRSGWDVTLPGGTITPAQMRSLVLRLGPKASEVALVPTPDGIRIAFLDEPTLKGIVKSLGGKVKTAGTLQGGYIENDWTKQRVGQGYFDAIRTMGTEKFDQFAPGIAARLRKIDARFAKETRGRFTLSPVIDEVRAAVADEGFAGLERLAKKYAIPVALLAVSLEELEAPPEGGA